ncbi:Myosin ID heavy chain [Glycine soja]|uniref:Myosin ID heavy chain n=1 Tax=Glycine soja TaxID=3848 RepID=A0A445HBB3_GLYSO|nr:Myosin ID heavy chain [Glycine soja]
MPRRVQIEDPKYDDVPDADEPEETIRFKSSNSNVSDDQEPFMGIKVRRKASLHRDHKGDYLNVPSHPFLIKILQKQGDNEVLFADRVLKFTGSGKMKRCVLMITDSAIYIVDPEVDALKRRIVLAAVERVCLSELSDNFFAVIVPSEYDLLMASTRKTEIVTVLVEATKAKSATGFELDVVFSNSCKRATWAVMLTLQCYLESSQRASAEQTHMVVLVVDVWWDVRIKLQGGTGLESSFFSVFAYQFWCSHFDSHTAMGTPDRLDEILFRLTQNQSSLGESMNSLTQKIEDLLTRVSPALFASASPSMSFPPSPTVLANTHRMKLDVPRFDGTDPLG